jgi:predicted RNA-binding protein with TRAM domain
MPWIIAGVLLFLLLGGGVLAGAFFFIIKPRLDEVAERRTEPVVQPTVEAVPSPSVEEPAPTPEFVPPPNTVLFENSNANLDGNLAEHYFDFSFYYPKSWQRDPNAGVPGARNFVKVERRLSSDSPQEDFAVGWYTSTGTFAGDLDNFPQRVREVSAALAKAYPEYRKVSEGPTKVNSMDAYEFRWEGLSQGDNGDIKLWGRVVFLPTGKEGDTAGATIVMLSTSLAPELSSVEDIGQKGEAPVILDSFRFGKKQ